MINKLVCFTLFFFNDAGSPISKDTQSIVLISDFFLPKKH